jgi:hypothetical protein
MTEQTIMADPAVTRQVYHPHQMHAYGHYGNAHQQYLQVHPGMKRGVPADAYQELQSKQHMVQYQHQGMMMGVPMARAQQMQGIPHPNVAHPQQQQQQQLFYAHN